MKKLLLLLLELIESKAIEKTGKKATKSGLYKSGNQIIPLSKGQRFPPSENNLWKIIVSV